MDGRDRRDTFREVTKTSAVPASWSNLVQTLDIGKYFHNICVPFNNNLKILKNQYIH